MKRLKQNVAPELWQVTYNWLLTLGNKPDLKYCREQITMHPDYPSMLSVTDYLDGGRMQYQAVQANAASISQFNYPLLAHIRQPGQEYMYLINSIEDWDEQEEIKKYWSGIAIFPEKNSSWESEQNSLYRKNSNKDKIIAAMAMLSAGVLFAFVAFYMHSVSKVLFGFQSLLGVVISVFLAGSELGYQGEIVKQVCGIVKNGGCENVLKSSYAKGFFGITPADLSLLYFSTQFLFFLNSSLYPFFLQSIFLIAYAALPAAVWSIYTQAFKLRQWCALCIGVVIVLVCQAVTVTILPNFNILSAAVLLPLALFFGFCILLYAVWYPVKQLVITNRTNRLKLVELKRWTSDASLFVSQWKEEQAVDTTIWQNDLLIGNIHSPIIITVACNPYCGPCAQAHIQLDDILSRYGNNIKVQVRLVFNGYNMQDKTYLAAKAILQQASVLKDESALQQMLADWFEWMDIEKWSKKWGNKSTEQDVSVLLRQHSDWVTNSSITYTPSFFINGKKMPGRYKVEDIEMLAPQLADMFRN